MSDPQESGLVDGPTEEADWEELDGHLEPDLEIDDGLSERLDRLFAAEPPAPAGPVSPVGQRLGKYTIQETVGYGSFGVVYRALDNQLGRVVALKLPRPEVLIDADRLDRFQGEATTAAALDHPAIVPIYEADLTGPAPYIASALCVGPDLRKWLDNRLTPPAPSHAAALIAELADGVQHAHEHGVLHRDLKPGNILLEPHDRASRTIEHLSECEPRLTDFGLARFVDGGLSETRSSLMVGTPLYMAPEQLNGDPAETRPTIDVYALGVLLYELLTLRTPFEGAGYIEVLDKVRNAEAEPLRRANPAAPKALQTICNKCLRKDPEDRYQSAGDLRDDLERFLDGEPILARAANVFDRFWRWCRLSQRVNQAGLCTFWAQIGITIWMAVVGLLAMRHSLMPEAMLVTTARDVLFISVSFHIPLSLLGWLIAKGERWAFPWGLAGSVFWLGVVCYSAFEPAIDFEYNYSTPMSKLNTFVALLLAAFVQTLMYPLAIPAWWRGRQRKD